MTRKDAIKVLRTESIELGGSAPSVCRFWEELDMAIAALREQEGKDTNAPTNADRIRAMSDEELADMLWKTGRNYRAICADPVVDYNEHRDNLIAWLKQPSKGE